MPMMSSRILLIYSSGTRKCQIWPKFARRLTFDTHFSASNHPCDITHGEGASVDKFSGFDASQAAIMAAKNHSEGCEAQTVPKEKNLEFLWNLLKKARLPAMSKVEVSETSKANDIHKKACKVMSRNISPIEESMMAFEKAVKKILAGSARKAVPGEVSGISTPELTCYS